MPRICCHCDDFVVERCKVRCADWRHKRLLDESRLEIGNETLVVGLVRG